MFMQRWNYALVVTVALTAPILVLLVVLPFEGLAFASHHHGDGPGSGPPSTSSGAYKQGITDGIFSKNNGDGYPTYERCISNNVNIYGFNTADYCNGFLFGYYDNGGTKGGE
jgi:hypothetical protein